MSKKHDMLGEYDFSKGKRGPVISHKGRTRITIFIDTDILEWFRDGNSGSALDTGRTFWRLNWDSREKRGTH